LKALLSLSITQPAFDKSLDSEILDLADESAKEYVSPSYRHLNLSVHKLCGYCERCFRIDTRSIPLERVRMPAYVWL